MKVMQTGTSGKITIRRERPEDYEAIDEVNRLAFGQDDEARLIRALREAGGFDPKLSLVAVRDDRVVGHVLFSSVTVATTGGPVPALALAPMAVHPEVQNQGIGSRLVRDGLEVCRRLGHPIVVVVGHPGYYPRFGFTPARARGLEAPFQAPDEAFRVLELIPGALDGVAGIIEYPPAFDAG